MDRFTPGGLAALAGYVALSSVLGLTGRFLLPQGDLARGAYELVVAVWSASVVADAIFVAGSVAAALVAFDLAGRRGYVAAAAAGLVLNWAVYVASYLALPNEGIGAILASQPYRVPAFVGMWGAVGLAFCAVAPPAARAFVDARSP